MLAGTNMFPTGILSAMERLLRWLAAAASLGMLLVLVMGAAVTNTGSAQGCGRSWPLCNGQFVPEFTVATAIEYSHRAVTGVEGVLIVALTLAMLVLWRHEREVQVLAPLMLGSLLLQAGLGAAAVMLPQSPAVLASHFGISLVAFASTLVSTVLVFERTGGPARSPGGSRARLPLGRAGRRACTCWWWSIWAPMCATAGSAWRAPTGRCAMVSSCPAWRAARASSSRTAWARSACSSCWAG